MLFVFSMLSLYQESLDNIAAGIAARRRSKSNDNGSGSAAVTGAVGLIMAETFANLIMAYPLTNLIMGDALTSLIMAKTFTNLYNDIATD